MESGQGKASLQAEGPGPSARGHAASQGQPQVMMNGGTNPTKQATSNSMIS